MIAIKPLPVLTRRLALTAIIDGNSANLPGLRFDMKTPP